MQLDLGHLQVKNSFSWHGSRMDLEAVHLDVLDAEVFSFNSFYVCMHALIFGLLHALILIVKLQILGINLAVGINDSIGKPMIREGRDIHVYVKRSLRDFFRKVPTFVLEVKVIILFSLQKFIIETVARYL